jgi:hypothetical protein
VGVCVCVCVLVYTHVVQSHPSPLSDKLYGIFGTPVRKLGPARTRVQTNAHTRTQHTRVHTQNKNTNRKEEQNTRMHAHTHTHTLAHACICIVALVESGDVIGNIEAEDTTENDLFPSPHEGECSLFLVSALVVLTFIYYLIR